MSKSPLHPLCQKCGWRRGGPDSWDGRACKCGLSEPPMPPLKLMLVPSANYLAQAAKAEEWLAAELKQLEADGYVREPGTLIWMKRDADGCEVASACL